MKSTWKYKLLRILAHLLPVLQVLNEAKLGILSIDWLEDRNTNITMQLSHIFKAFSDFRLVAQIRGEIEKVKPNLAFTTL